MFTERAHARRQLLQFLTGTIELIISPVNRNSCSARNQRRDDLSVMFQGVRVTRKVTEEQVKNVCSKYPA